MAPVSTPPRRLPAPWTVIEKTESYVVHDAAGRPIAYVYYDERSHTGTGFERHTKDEARRVASQIAKIPATRDYIHQLETHADPALTLQEVAALRAQVEELQAALAAKDPGGEAGA